MWHNGMSDYQLSLTYLTAHHDHAIKPERARTTDSKLKAVSKTIAFNFQSIINSEVSINSIKKILRKLNIMRKFFHLI